MGASFPSRFDRLAVVLAALAALGGAAVAIAAAPSHPCSDPCLQAARAGLRDCTSSARGAFQEALDGCIERDHICVDACRSIRAGCRDDTGTGAGIAACTALAVTEKARCRERFPPFSERREDCIDRAEVRASRCRRDVVRGARRALRACRQGFRQCVGACGPGGPIEGAKACVAEAKAAFDAVVADCRLTYQVTASACLDKDVTCVQDCRDAREVCAGPTTASVTAALAACASQEVAAVAACQAANPGGGAAFDQCVTAAQASATTCRDAALDAAAPGLEACTLQYVACVRACPAA